MTPPKDTNKAVTTDPKEMEIHELSNQNNPFIVFLLIIERGRGERDRNVNLLFYLFMYLLVVSYMCPDQCLNSQPWCIRMIL